MARDVPFDQVIRVKISEHVYDNVMIVMVSVKARNES